MRAAVIGNPAGVSYDAVGLDGALRIVGNNTGNLVFQHAVWMRVKEEKFIVGEMTTQAAEQVREAADVVVLPAANQINPQFDLSWWVKWLEMVDKPIVCIGLGAQAAIDSQGHMELTPGTLRFIDLLKERCKLIGVRGQFTADVLERYGCTNTAVTGCPSNFINPSVSGSSLAAKIAAVREFVPEKVAILFGTMEPETRAVELKTQQLFGRGDYSYVFQTNKTLIATAMGEKLHEQDYSYLNWQKSVLASGVELNTYIRSIKQRGRVFWNVPEWIANAGSIPLSIGTRIHASIVAVQSGSLGVCIPFDSRTKELVDTMGYPLLKLEDMLAAETADDAIAAIAFDPLVFDEKRKVLFDAVQRVLNSAGEITSAQ